MLKSSEADILGLIAVFVVLPLVIYFLLGKWSDLSNKKERISVFSQQVVEETYPVDDMTCADIATPLLSHSRNDVPTIRNYMPSRNGFHLCATCQAPATTRCSRCKSVRYCSGRCQIVHWRQGHKLACQQLHGNSVAVVSSASGVYQQMPTLTSLNSPVHESGTEKAKYEVNSGNTIGDHSGALYVHSNQSLINKLKQVKFVREVDSSCSLHRDEVPSSNGVSAYSSLDNKLTNAAVGTSNGSRHTDDTAFEATKSTMCVPSISPGEMRKRVKPFSSPGITVYEQVNNFPVSVNMEHPHFGEFVLDAEPPERAHTSRRKSCNGSVIYRDSAYNTGATVSTPHQANTTQHSVERETSERKFSKKDEPRTCQNSPVDNYSNGYVGVTLTGGIKTESLKKPGNFHRYNLVQLINDNKRNQIIHMLFPYDDLVKFFMSDVRGVCPRGLLNYGNSCYANAVLQCLTCTKPLMIYLLQRLHSSNCRSKNWCLMCELEQHALLLRECGGPISLSTMLSNMRDAGFHLGGGSQEDAHEFLRLLVMSMQSACLDGLGGEKVIEQRLQETTLVQQLFGGRLKSKVKCLRCHHESERYENIMDLTLEINGWVESLQDALTQFTSPEDLDGENMYKCGRCATYVNARKQLSLHEVPNILTIVLKRFQTGSYGKINKCVSFPDMLNMIPFVIGTADSPPMYHLYGVVVHLDRENASFSGHYISYVKDMQGQWLRIDDSEVRTASLSQVMSEGAYMLFYSRSSPRPPRILLEGALLHATSSTKHRTTRSQKPPKPNEDRKAGTIRASDSQTRGMHDFTNIDKPNISRSVCSSNPVSSDFSDATSLFTSSDESSFTTESTRDSVSVADCSDYTWMDSMASLHAAYYPNRTDFNSSSCTSLSASNPQIVYIGEGSVASTSSVPTHWSRKSERDYALPVDEGLHGQNGVLQTSGFCDF